MIKNSIIYNNEKWEILLYLESLRVPTNLENIKDDLNQSENHILEAIEFLASLNYEIALKREGDVVLLVPPSEKIKVSFNLSLLEWIALQGHFPLFEKYNGKKFLETISSKLGEVEKENPHLDFFSILKYTNEKDFLYKNLDAFQKDNVNKIDIAVMSQNDIYLKTEGKVHHVFPHRVVYIDGSLSLVCEDCEDQLLTLFCLGKIEEVKEIIGNNYHSNYTIFETNEFINALRSISGSEVRVIIKILDNNSIDYNPKYHFLGNQYITNNAEGDTIWAANVELSEDFLNWLMANKDNIDILDPQDLKESFNSCKLENKSILKKVS